MVRILIAGIVGAIVLFVWGMLWWVASPLPMTVIRSIPNEAAVTGTLSRELPSSGVYLFPGMAEIEAAAEGAARDEANQAWTERHRAGPLGLIHFRSAGAEPMAPTVFVKGLLLNLIMALLASVFIATAARAGMGYAGRALIAVLLGAFASVAGFATEWNWMFMPGDYALLRSGETVGGWVVTGLVLAAIIRPGTRDPREESVRPAASH